VPAFAYSAVDSTGRRLSGQAEAASPGALTHVLEERGLLVLGVTERTDGGFVGLRPSRRRGVLEVTRALAALIPAGMPLVRALGAAAEMASGRVRDGLQQVRERVEHGNSLAEALEMFPDLFPSLYTGVVRAGERSGDLAGAFTRLAEQLDREDKLRSRLLSLSIYPLLLAIAGGAAVLVLLLFVLPRFAELLQGAGAALPRSTALLLNFGAAMRLGWPVLLALPVLAVLAGMWVKRTEEGQRAMAALLLGVPVVRTLRRQTLAARFARLLGVLLGGGAPLLTALDQTVDSLTDPIAREETARIRDRVREGSPLGTTLAEGGLFPRLLGQLVSVGEEAGRLHEFLMKAAEIFEDRTEQATQRLVTLLEPAMILVFGSVVAFIALALLQAIYGVNASAFR
jgi:type II secretory pathway component PulF